MAIQLGLPAAGLLSKVGWGLTGLSAVSAVPIIGDMSYNTRERILEDGPRADGKFRTNWWQNLLIDEENLKPEWDRRQYQDARRGPQAADIAEIERLVPGAVFKPGMDAGEFVANNRGKYRRASQKEKISDQLGLQSALWNSPEQRAEREKSERRYYDSLRRQNRNDAAQLRLDTQRLDLQKQQQHNEMIKHQRELQVHREDKRRDQWLAVASGLSALGGAFAM